MDLIKKLTGKNPSEYELVAKSLVDNADVTLFENLVKQDDFLFDFIKNNVAKRIQDACNKENYLNLIKFFETYSSSYDTMIARVLHSFSGDELLPEMKEIYLNGSDSAKSYAVKYFSFVTPDRLVEILPLLRQTALSSYEPLAYNSIEILSILNDEDSKNNALERLSSNDEFEQYNAVKFLVNYKAKDCINEIIETMKKSSFSENIASEILDLIDIEELLEKDFDNTILILCNIINAIPEILPPSVIYNYGLNDIFKKLSLTSTSAVLFRLAKSKLEELTSNDEYLYDSDKNTKDEIFELNKFLKNFHEKKLESLLYDELYDESDFVFYAIDFVDEIQELEELINSKNETLILKVLTMLKEKQALTVEHKQQALSLISSNDIRAVVDVL